jgi:hypothetical protein
MLEYELLGIVDGVATYQYYPDGDRENPGMVRFDSNFKMIDYTPSKEDPGAYYAAKLFHWFERQNEFDDSGFIAWG